MIPRSRIILHALPRVLAFLVAFALAAFLLADLIALLVDHAPHVGTLLVGWMLGVLTVAVVSGHDRRRRAPVVLAELPSARLNVATKWRREHAGAWWSARRGGGK
jgi:hypothetical protein